MNRTDALNHVIQKMGFKSYLEIGIQHGVNFTKIKCASKIGVDPGVSEVAGHKIVSKTSDEYFSASKAGVDLIFIDGDHSAEQSMKDFNNALEHLNEGGCIAFHDALPHNEEYTGPLWCGEVYKTCLEVSKKYYVTTFEEDHGVCFVWPEVANIQDDRVSFDKYPGIAQLKKWLNATSDLNQLIPQLSETAKHEDGDPRSDDELKEQYKQLSGSGYRGKFKRETIIQKINELRAKHIDSDAT